MNLTKLLAMAVLVCLPFAQPAHADWYAGLDVGAARSDSNIDEHFLIGDSTDRASSSTTGFRLRGGYQFGRFFALELAYVDFGQSTNHFDPNDCPAGAPGPCPVDVRTSINGIVGTLVGIVPIGEHWYFDARLGYGTLKIKADASGTTDLDGRNDDAPGAHYGIGAGYRFNENWEVLLDYSEYDQLDFGLTLAGDFGVYDLGETSVTSFGVSYHW
jgi:opacity protein-like surface antigen